MLRALLLLTTLVHVHVLAKVQMVLIQKLFVSNHWYGDHGDPFARFNCFEFSNPDLPPGLDNLVPPAYDRLDLVRESVCEDNEQHQFLIAEDEVSTIRPAVRPDLCIEVPEMIVQPSTLSFKPCVAGLATQLFSLPRSSTMYRYISGPICMASNPGCCIGSFETKETCTSTYSQGEDNYIHELSWKESVGCWGVGFLTGVLGISNATSSNVSSDTRNVLFVWHIITAHPDMWLGSRVAEGFALKVIIWYLIFCVILYAVYVVKNLCRQIHMIRSNGASSLRIQKWLIYARRVLRFTIRSICALRDKDVPSDEFLCILQRRRMQRAQVYSRKVMHVASIYAVIKIRQLWDAHASSNVCSDAVNACDAGTARMYIYNYELFPFFTLVYPALVVLALLGDRIQPCICDTFIGILSVGWIFHKILYHTRDYGFTAAKVLCCRIAQVVILGNPRLTILFEILVDLSVKAYTFGVCSSGPHRPIDSHSLDGPCPNEQSFSGFFLTTQGLSGVEVFILSFVVTFVYVLDSGHAREVLEKRRGAARDLALSMLQRHLDVLYDCVVHLNDSLEISIGAPKLAGLLMRGLISDQSLKGRQLVEMMADGDRQRFVEHMKSASHTDRVSVLHVSFIDGDGRIVPCELFTSSATDAEGTISYILGIREVSDEVGSQRGSQSHELSTSQQRTLVDGSINTNEAEHHVDVDLDSPALAGSLTRDAAPFELPRPSTSRSNSSASKSEEDIDLRLTLVWGGDEGARFVSCTTQLMLSLGRVLDGALVSECLEDASGIDEWLQISAWSWSRRVATQPLGFHPLKLFFKASRYRPKLSATLLIEDVSRPIMDDGFLSRRFTARVTRLRIDNNPINTMGRKPLRRSKRQVSKTRILL